MPRWIHSNRFYVLISTFCILVGLYIVVQLTVPSGSIQIVKLTEGYALLAAGYLYISLLISPLYYSIPKLPYKALVVQARRPLGVSSFFAALLHFYYAFFIQLGGIAGLPFLNRTYLIAIVLSTTALLILLALAATSFDAAIKKLKSIVWKRIHQLIYLAGFLIVIHALLLGSHFSDPTGNSVGEISLVLVAGLLILEARRLDGYLSKKLPSLPKVGVMVVITILLLTLAPHYLGFGVDASNAGSLNIHAEHTLIAKDAQQSSLTYNSALINTNSPAVQGLRGDRTRRFTVSFNTPATIQSNRETPLNIKVYDASSGYPTVLFSKVYSKLAHLIIVDDTLTTFIHIHPELTDDNGTFRVQATFPHDGQYHVYLDYQPMGAIEQQQAFTLQVGVTSVANQPSQAVDDVLTKTFGKYSIALQPSQILTASELSVGNQSIAFTLTDATTKQSVTNLKPYLESFGHLVLINQQTFEYIHVHPNNVTVPPPESTGGPTVTFVPLGLYGPIKPGVYRAFAEFNPDNQLLVADYTILIQ